MVYANGMYRHLKFILFYYYNVSTIHLHFIYHTKFHYLNDNKQRNNYSRNYHIIIFRSTQKLVNIKNRKT